MSFVSTFDHTNPMTDSKLTASQLDQLKLNYAELIVEVYGYGYVDHFCGRKY